MAYEAKNELVRGRQLKVQELCIPFLITANATPASKVLTKDEPALLFLKVEGIDQCTVAAGCFDTSAEASAITFATSADSTGIFSCVVKISESLSKVVSARIVSRAGTSDIVAATFPTGATSGISSAGDKIVLDFNAGRDFSSANGDYCLEIKYVVAD